LKNFSLLLIAFAFISTAQAGDQLVLSNDAWPPFILEGSDQGTAEKLVCQALQLAGWSCEVKVQEWEMVLQQARSGAIDGIAAAWRDKDREKYLLFSEPYLSNRIIPVVSRAGSVTIHSASDLSGLRIALGTDFAYGDEIEALKPTFEVVEAANPREALSLVARGKADAALMDELVARDLLAAPSMSGLMINETVMAFRDLHFAVSKKRPDAAAIIEDFQRSYKQMLSDGTVNDILNVDWLATDFGQKGKLDVVMRNGISLDELTSPADEGEVFALEASEYDLMQQRDMDPSRVSYQVKGNSYSSLQSAIEEVFGKDTVCKHKNYTSQFDCSDLFK
jgi:polar amino acid transport system substrate-binding protein